MSRGMRRWGVVAAGIVSLGVSSCVWVLSEATDGGVVDGPIIILSLTGGEPGTWTKADSALTREGEVKLDYGGPAKGSLRKDFFFLSKTASLVLHYKDKDGKEKCTAASSATIHTYQGIDVSIASGGENKGLRWRLGTGNLKGKETYPETKLPREFAGAYSVESSAITDDDTVIQLMLRPKIADPCK